MTIQLWLSFSNFCCICISSTVYSDKVASYCNSAFYNCVWCFAPLTIVDIMLHHIIVANTEFFSSGNYYLSYSAVGADSHRSGYWGHSKEDQGAVLSHPTRPSWSQDTADGPSSTYHKELYQCIFNVYKRVLVYKNEKSKWYVNFVFVLEILVFYLKGRREKSFNN